jgi:YrbI family 3-deoxy-D-manno-octulosonate 8-phosphate phosphatase
VIDPDLARSIRLVAFDVDGVMTDGGVYLGDVGGTRIEFKRYEIQDGLGVAMLRLMEIPVAIVTGRVSEGVRLRGEELGVDHVAQDPDGYKLAGFTTILEKCGVAPEHAAFVGDDSPTCRCCVSSDCRWLWPTPFPRFAPSANTSSRERGAVAPFASSLRIFSRHAASGTRRGTGMWTRAPAPGM